MCADVVTLYKSYGHRDMNQKYKRRRSQILVPGIIKLEIIITFVLSRVI
jgi:hypothetical protein